VTLKPKATEAEFKAVLRGELGHLYGPVLLKKLLTKLHSQMIDTAMWWSRIEEKQRTANDLLLELSDEELESQVYFGRTEGTDNYLLIIYPVAGGFHTYSHFPGSMG
jgi:hypothetical protein